LVQFDFDTQRYWVKAAAPLAIADAPRFPHRQILIDTARHFEPIAILRKMVDAISYAKVNTIHWHMTDAESFPFDSKRRPLLSRKGAFSAQERYSPLDVAGLVEYSRTRGVRLMVEFDAPGHAAPSWCKGYPDACPPAPGCWHLLDYSSNETYSLLDDLLSDVADVFPESIVHLGGDECGGVDACAARIPSIGAWLRENGLNGTDGYLYFVKRCGNRPCSEPFVHENDHFAKTGSRHTSETLRDKACVLAWQGPSDSAQQGAAGSGVGRHLETVRHSVA
jgi:hexosaminidase